MPAVMSLVKSQSKETDLASLEILVRHIVAGMQQLFDVSTSGVVRIAAGAANTARYPEWRIAQNPFGALLRFRFANGGNELLVHLPGYFVSQIVDLHYGGRGVVSVRSGFSATERHFVHSFGEQFSTLLNGTGASETVQADFVELHTDLLGAHWPQLRDNVVLQTIFAESESINPTAITLVMAAETVQLLSDASSHDRAAIMRLDPAWAEKMRDAAMQLQVSARVILMRNQLSVQRLLTLVPGDVLPLVLPSQIPLIVEGRIFAHGTLGEANGRAALSIEKIGKEIDR